jgi:hypothetical protein
MTTFRKLQSFFATSSVGGWHHEVHDIDSKNGSPAFSLRRQFVGPNQTIGLMEGRNKTAGPDGLPYGRATFPHP